MKKFLKHVLITCLTIFILAWALPTVNFTNWTTLILASVVLTLLKKIAKPVLKILFLPINIVTLGLFSLVINVALLWLATFLVPGFEISAMTILGINFNQFFSLLLISFAISIIQGSIDVFI